MAHVIKIEGVNEFKNRLKLVDVMLAGNMRRGLGKAGLLLQRLSQKIVPIDTGALKKALCENRLAAAVLDVWEEEPAIDLELLDLVRIGTTHIAGYSTDGKAKGTSMSVQAVSRFFGLGLDDWYPRTLPAPLQPEITLDGNGMALQDVLLHVVNHAYNVLDDDRRLRASPELFEEIRGSYPVRREPGAYRVKIINDQAGAGSVLEGLGFRVVRERLID